MAGLPGHLSRVRSSLEKRLTRQCAKSARKQACGYGLRVSSAAASIPTRGARWSTWRPGLLTEPRLLSATGRSSPKCGGWRRPRPTSSWAARSRTRPWLPAGNPGNAGLGVTEGEGRNYPDDLPRHSVSAGGAVIRRDGRMLAIKRADNGEWVLPGGIVELDEDPRDTVRREVLEETGVTVETGQLTGVYKNMRLGVVSMVFRCSYLSGDPQPTEEATEVDWLDSAQVTSRMADAFSRLGSSMPWRRTSRHASVFMTVSMCSAGTLSRDGCFRLAGSGLPKAGLPCLC